MALDFHKVFYSFWGGRKRRRLQEAIYGTDDLTCPSCALNVLWSYADQSSPDGIFRNKPDKEIEDEVNWRGEKGAFVKALIDSNFLSRWSKLDETKKGTRYKRIWYRYKHSEFDEPEADDLVLMSWFEHNPHHHPDNIYKASERGRKNQAKRNKG
jgi:hypothetical protein